MVIFSFFSGVGMLDLGFEQAGFEIVLVNEYCKEFLEAYKYARRVKYNIEPRLGYYNCDINEFLKQPYIGILEKQISELREQGECIGFIGGPPCPDFSVGGKNKGRDGENGKLAKSYVELIDYYQPDFFLFENVKGLIKTKRHREYFEELKANLNRNDYILSEALLNALEFGVPQDRERILLIGIRNNSVLSKKIIILNNSFAFPWNRNKNYLLEEIRDYKWPETERFRQYSVRKFKYAFPKELTVEYWFQKNDVYHHPNRKDKFKVRSEKMKTIEEGDVSRKSFKRLHRWRYSPTAAYGNNEVHLHPYRSRRISVAEAMAIQSLPEWFELPPNLGLSTKFKTIGNGVPYRMSYALAKTIQEYFML